MHAPAASMCEDILELVFDYVPFETVFAVSQVCALWRPIALRRLWRQLDERHFRLFKRGLLVDLLPHYGHLVRTLILPPWQVLYDRWHHEHAELLSAGNSSDSSDSSEAQSQQHSQLQSQQLESQLQPQLQSQQRQPHQNEYQHQQSNHHDTDNNNTHSNTDSYSHGRYHRHRQDMAIADCCGYQYHLHHQSSALASNCPLISTILQQQSRHQHEHDSERDSERDSESHGADRGGDIARDGETVVQGQANQSQHDQTRHQQHQHQHDDHHDHHDNHDNNQQRQPHVAQPWTVVLDSRTLNCYMSHNPGAAVLLVTCCNHLQSLNIHHTPINTPDDALFRLFMSSNVRNLARLTVSFSLLNGCLPALIASVASSLQSLHILIDDWLGIVRGYAADDGDDAPSAAVSAAAVSATSTPAIRPSSRHTTDGAHHRDDDSDRYNDGDNNSDNSDNNDDDGNNDDEDDNHSDDSDGDNDHGNNGHGNNGHGDGTRSAVSPAISLTPAASETPSRTSSSTPLFMASSAGQLALPSALGISNNSPRHGARRSGGASRLRHDSSASSRYSRYSGSSEHSRNSSIHSRNHKSARRHHTRPASRARTDSSVFTDVDSIRSQSESADSVDSMDSINSSVDSIASANSINSNNSIASITSANSISMNSITSSNSENSTAFAQRYAAAARRLGDEVAAALGTKVGECPAAAAVIVPWNLKSLEFTIYHVPEPLVRAIHSSPVAARLKSLAFFGRFSPHALDALLSLPWPSLAHLGLQYIQLDTAVRFSSAMFPALRKININVDDEGFDDARSPLSAGHGSWTGSNGSNSSVSSGSNNSRNSSISSTNSNNGGMAGMAGSLLGTAAAAHGPRFAAMAISPVLQTQSDQQHHHRQYNQYQHQYNQHQQHNPPLRHRRSSNPPNPWNASLPPHPARPLHASLSPRPSAGTVSPDAAFRAFIAQQWPAVHALEMTGPRLAMHALANIHVSTPLLTRLTLYFDTSAHFAPEDHFSIFCGLRFLRSLTILGIGTVDPVICRWEWACAHLSDLTLARGVLPACFLATLHMCLRRLLHLSLTDIECDIRDAVEHVAALGPHPTLRYLMCDSPGLDDSVLLQLCTQSMPHLTRVDAAGSSVSADGARRVSAACPGLVVGIGPAMMADAGAGAGSGNDDGNDSGNGDATGDATGDDRGEWLTATDCSLCFPQ